MLWCQLPLKSAMMDTEGLGVRRGAGTLDPGKISPLTCFSPLLVDGLLKTLLSSNFPSTHSSISFSW